MNENVASIQWFPGHMAKTRRIMKENLGLVDVVVEIRDARIPISSRNPEITQLVGQKPRIVLLCKSDLADPETTKKWIDYYKRKQLPALAVDCKRGTGLDKFPPLVKSTIPELLQRRKDRGMQGRPTRVMVVGVPNVGKSSFINKMAGSNRLDVENRPGVTLRKQWIKAADGLELLDMPGVLWPKFEDPIVGENLALTGAVKDDVLDIELLAMRLLWRMQTSYPESLEERYKFTEKDTDGLDSYDLLCLLGRKRGMLISGGEIDTERAANTALDDFRNGRLGKVSLEDPPEN